MIVMLLIEVKPEPEITPFVEDLVIETSSARQAAPPLIMSIKTLFPLYLLCMNRMITLSILTAYLNPYPLHDLSFNHSSKQTTILADIGVVCVHVAPSTVTAYMHFSGYNVVTVVEER